MSSDISAYLPPPKRLPPPEVGSVISAWWLALGSGVVGIAGMWPNIVNALQGKSEQLGTGGLLGWLLLVVLVIGAVVVGGVVSSRMAKGGPGGLRLMKLFLIVGLLAGVAIVAASLYFKPAPPAAVPGAKSDMDMGAISSIALLGFLAVIPLAFAFLAFSLTGNDAVTRHFTAVEAPQQQTYTYTAPAQPREEDMEVTAAAEDVVTEAVDLEPDLSSEVQVTIDDPDAPSTQIRKGKDTMLQQDD